MTIEKLSTYKNFGGWNKQYHHYSRCLNCLMRFTIYLPPQATIQHPAPVLYWLSGLTCTDENFIQKAGAQRIAAELGIAIVTPDTSPRGKNIADADSYDLGQGAGFYVNATQAPWSHHYQMYDYVLDELPQLIESTFPVTDKRAISGHSMGGHGALVLALRNPNYFTSVSAFSPICHPTQCPWGKKAFMEYLGTNKAKWNDYDAYELLLKANNFVPALIYQGLSDDFLSSQLMPQYLEQASDRNKYPLNLVYHKDYDHSYYFIASFIANHLHFHAKHLFT